MFKSALFSLMILLPIGAHAASTHWTIDPAKSHLTFSGTQQGGPFDGQFKGFTGTIDFDPADLPHSHADIDVDMKTATTNSPDRDAYLPQADWFATEKFAKAHYGVTTFSEKNGEYIAHGALTIRNKTQQLDLPFKLKIDGGTAHAKGEVILKRLDFGVGQGEWKDTSTVGDSVKVKLDIVATAH